MAGIGGRQPRPPESRGQTETIGMVIVLSMTIVGATVALGFGAAAIDNAREDSNEEGIRNAMTQLDSRAARVALGDSSVQHVTLATGSYRVDPDAGWINITHINHTGSGDTEVIYNESLGAVIYDGDEVDIAYQGGGVWSTTGNSSTMVSPPEFHYRGSTLTLPVLRLVESDSGAGPVTAKITQDGALSRVYPNQSKSYDADSSTYQNPINEGNVSVKIHSEYYQAWAEYFRTRTEGDITVFDSNNTVEVILLSTGTVGDFDMPAEGNSVKVNSMAGGHPVDNFEITLKPDPHFGNMHWAFYADEGGEEFELHIHSSDKCSGGYSDDLDVSIYYYNGSGSTYEGWQNTSVSPNGPLINVDCSANEMVVDFMASTLLEYDEIEITGSDNKWEYGDQISSMSVASSIELDQHPGVSGEPETYSENTDKESVSFLVNHYLSILGPSFELQVTDGPGGSSRIDEDDSSGSLDYDEGGSAKFITFLHITENRIAVELD